MTLTIDAAKAQAKALRQALAAQGTAVSHSQALELVAQQHGARDWNTLHARLGLGNAPPELKLGSRVEARYLGQSCRGEVVGLSGPEGFRKVEIKLDAPVDTVQSEHFSNWRHRIHATLDTEGRSHSCTSDGRPHLVVDRVLG
ncbi:glyoxalase superfamily protein [Pseudooceanicola sp. 502str34]